MKKLLVLPLILFLTACATTDNGAGSLAKPVQVPELPANLSKKADRLPPITDNTMGGLTIDGAETDIKYNTVAHQLNNLIDVYECVRVSMNEKRNPEECFK